MFKIAYKNALGECCFKYHKNEIEKREKYNHPVHVKAVFTKAIPVPTTKTGMQIFFLVPTETLCTANFAGLY